MQMMTLARRFLMNVNHEITKASFLLMCSLRCCTQTDETRCPTTTSSYTNLNDGGAMTQAEAIQVVGHCKWPISLCHGLCPLLHTPPIHTHTPVQCTKASSHAPPLCTDCCTDGISTCGAADGSLIPGGADDDEYNICFSGDSTVQLASGATKTMADLEVGDSVLSADATGKLSYSAVAFKPHAANAKAATFVKVTTESGKAVTATPTHLLVSCDGSLVQAKAAACLRTVNGDEAVTSIESFKANGIYSAVTLDNEYLVVDGVVASPFALAHGLVHAYYNLHRTVYKHFPSLMKMPAVVSANSLLASGAVMAMNAVGASEK